MFTATQCPLKQIIGQTITYNGATSSFKVKAWQHKTLCRRELMVHTGLVMSVYAKLPCNNLQWTFLPQICMVLVATYASQTPRIHCFTQMKFAPGWALVWVNFDSIQEFGPKVGGWHSFEDGCSFMRLQYALNKRCNEGNAQQAAMTVIRSTMMQ